MAGASVTKTTELFGVVRSTVTKIMTAFEKAGKSPHWSKTKRKLSDKNSRTLTQIVWKDHKNTVTAELNDHLENPVSSQKLRERSCTKPDFTGGLQPENHIKTNLFEMKVFPLSCPTPVSFSIFQIKFCFCAYLRSFTWSSQLVTDYIWPERCSSSTISQSSKNILQHL